MLPELRTDLFGKNENRKFYNVSRQPCPRKRTLTCSEQCIDRCQGMQPFFALDTGRVIYDMTWIEGTLSNTVLHRCIQH